nr:MAG TPA: hypothetical protein [Caudoviricetes sp.]
MSRHLPPVSTRMQRGGAGILFCSAAPAAVRPAEV